jgi:hypothetical protein
MRFLRTVAGCRMMGHERNKDIREDQGITDKNTIGTREHSG